MTLKCSKCQENKPDEAFCRLNSGAANRNRRGRSYVCRQCASQIRNIERERERNGQYREDLAWCKRQADGQRTRHEANPDHRRNHYLLKRYGITIEEYRQMEEEQGYRCKICGIHVKRVKQHRLYVDHNHETGEVRGLLCSSCNIGLGYLEDISWVQNTKNYLLETIGIETIK